MSKTSIRSILSRTQSKTTKKACERYQNLSTEEKEQKNNMVVNVIKISQRIKNKILLSIEKHIIEWGKTSYYKN